MIWWCGFKNLFFMNTSTTLWNFMNICPWGSFECYALSLLHLTFSTSIFHSLSTRWRKFMTSNLKTSLVQRLFLCCCESTRKRKIKRNESTWKLCCSHNLLFQKELRLNLSRHLKKSWIKGLRLTLWVLQIFLL